MANKDNFAERKEDTEVTMRRGSTTEPYAQNKVEGPVTWEELRPMLRQERMAGVSTRTWRPDAAGILNIIAGAANLMVGITAVIGATFLSDLFSGVIDLGAYAGIGLGIALIVLGLISIVGGAMALQRRRWGWALAGSITSLFPSPAFILGIASLVFLVIGRYEFHDRP